MTLGFVAAEWRDNEDPQVMVVADSRYSLVGSDPIDTGLKTYELGGNSAMVASGHALPALIASELVRPLVENHNRCSKTALGFYDTVRLLAFFLKRSATDQWEQRSTDSPWSCHVAVTGFLQSGAPCLASIIISPNQNRVHFQSLREHGSIFFSVGNSEGKAFLLQGLAAAKFEGRSLLPAGASLLWYMSSHPGAFSSIGGGISIGVCWRKIRHFSWPIIEIDSFSYLRGVDVSNCISPGWPRPEVVPYDESWCAGLDKKLHRDLQVVSRYEEVVGSGYEIDSMSTPENLFKTRDDPAGFENGIASER
jgi:hypothetical protein